MSFLRINNFRFVAAVTVLALLFSGCRREHNELKHDHQHEGHSHEGHNHEHEDENHGDEIIVKPELAAKMGVATTIIKKETFSPSIRVSGRIDGTNSSLGTVSAHTAGTFSLSPSVTVGQTVRKGQVIGSINTKTANGGDVNAAGAATLAAARKEMERLKPLYDEKLITADKYNAAVSAYEIARAAYNAGNVSGTVVAPTSGTIREIAVGQGQYVEPGTPIAFITDGSRLQLTADVPDRYASYLGNFTTASVVVPGSEVAVDLSALNAKKVTSQTTVSGGYFPVTFTFENNGILYPGAIVEVFLPVDSGREVISVPVSAITEQQGATFVYVRVDEEGYKKVPVKIGGRDALNVEILSGLEGGEEVVTAGTTALRLAETSGAVPEGHSHSH